MALLDDSDFVRLRSLAFSSVLDLAAVRGFLQAVFSPAAEGQAVPRRGKAAAKAKGKAAKGKAGGGAGGQRGRKRKLAAEEEDAEEEREVEAEGSDDEEAEAETAAAAGEAGASQEQEPEAGVEAPAPPRRFGVLAVKKLAAELDMREDSMEAVLSYLEAAAAPCLRMLPTTALSVKVSFYAAAAEALAAQYPVVRVRRGRADEGLRRAALRCAVPCCAAGGEGRAAAESLLLDSCMQLRILLDACGRAGASRVPPTSPHPRPRPTPPLSSPQVVLEACPNPRNGVYSAPAARLAAVAQKAPGLVLQELRDMAAGSLIGFELSRDEGPAYEASARGGAGGVLEGRERPCLGRPAALAEGGFVLACMLINGAVRSVPAPPKTRADPAHPRRPGGPGTAGARPPAGGAGLPGVAPGCVVPRAGGGAGGRPGGGRRRGGAAGGAGGRAAGGGGGVFRGGGPPGRRRRRRWQ